MAYQVEITKSAARELADIPAKDQKRIVAKIRGLAENPRPPGCEKLSGEEKYRLRQGNYRILYRVNDDAVIVVVVKIADRKEVYKP